MTVRLAVVLVFTLLACAPFGAAAGDVTKAEYDRVKMGMSYVEVVDILGPPDEELSQSEIAGYVTVMYMWEGSGGLGANLNIMFQNDRVVNKAQFGLR
jgi:hypothetical protein